MTKNHLKYSKKIKCDGPAGRTDRAGCRVAQHATKKSRAAIKAGRRDLILHIKEKEVRFNVQVNHEHDLMRRV